MEVGLLTEQQKNQLVGVMYLPDVYYNPIEDCNNNWVISTQEMELTTDENFLWLKELPLIEYCIKPFPF
jgi:hypothetical protein